MAASNNLEIKGKLNVNAFAELLLEIAEAHLTGSLRLASESEKVIVYFIGGTIVFTVSNSRHHRLFEILLRENIITRNQLAGVSDFTNDFALCDYLKKNKTFSEEETNLFFTRQFEEILKTVFDWKSGEWIFSPQTRIKDGIRFKVDTAKLLLNYARNLSDAEIVSRFKTEPENFAAKPSVPGDTILFPNEGFVLSRFEKSFLSVNEIVQMCGLPEAAVLRIIYTLWLGNFLLRQNRQTAFSEQKISDILSANFTLKKETAPTVQNLAKFELEIPDEESAEAVAESDIDQPYEISLGKYLNQIENASNLYEVLNIPIGCDFQKIKRRYFSLAKQFHPDMFHQEKDAKLVQKIQNAFALTAQAYDTLKNDETRKVYDYKLEKSLSGTKSDAPAEPPKPPVEQPVITDDSINSFTKGFALLMDEQFQDAVPYLARAVQLDPDNAKYHAYYGKALSSDNSRRYQADMELQTAIRLDLTNISYRMMSAEFYIQFGLYKRAEGELKRLLNIAPNNSEAIEMMKSLPKK